MPLKHLVATLLFAVSTALAQAPLPGLRIEATAGGSIFSVRNTYSQPLTAFLIELVNYPGSSYTLAQDRVTEPVLPGAEERIQVTNMTVGAAPEYVKIQAAIYADGVMAGTPEKTGQLLEHRHARLATTRELIARLAKAGSKEAAIAELKAWSESIPAVAKKNRNTPEMFRYLGATSAIAGALTYLRDHSLEDTLAYMRDAERALVASKPALG